MHGENTLKARNLWAEQEDHVLRREVVKQGSTASRLGKPIDWRAIADKLPGRSNKDCRKRWIKLDSKINKGLWSEEENKRLHEAVAKYSTVWTDVAQVVGTRQPDQCAKRWQHFLNPGLNRSEWTPEEDEVLLAEVEKRGRNWKQIVDEALHRRSANDAKNRFTILQRMRQTTNNSNSTSPGQCRPTTSRTTPDTAESSPLPSPPSSQLDIVPYGVPPESTGGKPTTSSHRHHHMHHMHHLQQRPVPTIGTSELGHDDLHLGSMFLPSANKELSANTTSSPSSSYLGPGGSTPPEMLGEMGTEPTSVSLESWMDYVMGTGLLGDDCSTPALCDDDSSRMDSTRSSEESEMQLDAPPPPIPLLPPTAATSISTTTDPRLTTLDSLQASLEWNWDQMHAQIPGMELALTPPDREAIKSRRTMILQQMQPEQISRVMEFLLSWNTPIDVKIVNQE
ncbi:hypothetical protein BJX66DRAFT_241998 [Aspergillus keveii]|uniref:Uncharacterized protein n=1 Tax=Aspergillus keveii TaxID=714993 RepID=A0ABR4GKE2_9EURO